MSKVKVKTISSVHIGSGNFLRNNSDFVVWDENGESLIGILDPKKMLSIIGVDKINNWISVIERNGDTIEFMKNVGGCKSPRKYVQRVIYNYAQIGNNDTLKECLHDGMGRAYIPGSSIKGAIRTAITAVLAQKIQRLEDKVVFRVGNRDKVQASNVEKLLFGQNPNSDVFRFLHIGDVYFGACEIASKLVNLNIRRSEKLKDNSKSQLVESIFAEDESITQMKLDTRYYQWAKNHWQGRECLGTLSEEMNSLSVLFSVINQHTRTLVEEEIEYWRDKQSNGYQGAEDYIDSMQEILEEIGKCDNGKQCVLRLGHASGWRFITGAWTEQLSNFNSHIIPASRPRNNLYSDYDFPKSRRIDEEGYVCGFIKLTLCD